MEFFIQVLGPLMAIPFDVSKQFIGVIFNTLKIQVLLTSRSLMFI